MRGSAQCGFALLRPTLLPAPPVPAARGSGGGRSPGHRQRWHALHELHKIRLALRIVFAYCSLAAIQLR
jgi:hypothetical protein